MASKLKLLNFKATEEEIAAWDAFANRTVHRNRSRWIRETLNRACASPSGGGYSPTVTTLTTGTTVKAKNLLDKAMEAKAKTGKCERRLPKGTFCKACGKIHA